MHLYIVTGSSRGLGAALVEQLTQPGHTVIGIARRSNPALKAEQWRWTWPTPCPPLSACRPGCVPTAAGRAPR